MTRTEDLCQGYGSVVDSLDLPDRIALVYRPEACLVERQDRSMWLLRRWCDEAPFVLKIAREGGEDLEEEFLLLSQLYPALAGHVPLAADCFQQEGTFYLVRSYLPGTCLTRYLDRTGPCDEEDCRQLGLRLAALLDQLHHLSPPIIHRDIKPDNIIISPDGDVGLIDFGIARQYKPDRPSDTRIMGSSVTAPPEQYGFSQTDGRTDLYALGATLIWTLTGSYDRQSLDKAPISRQLKEVLRKCTAFSPNDRYPSVRPLADALRGSAHRRRRLGRIVAAAFVLAICVGAAAGISLSRAQGSQPVEFPSYCLELAVREELDRPLGEITYSDLEQVEGLPIATLMLCDNDIQDLAPLSGLPLVRLSLGWRTVSDGDWSLLGELPLLEEISLWGKVGDTVDWAGINTFFDGIFYTADDLNAANTEVDLAELGPSPIGTQAGLDALAEYGLSLTYDEQTLEDGYRRADNLITGPFTKATNGWVKISIPVYATVGTSDPQFPLDQNFWFANDENGDAQLVYGNVDVYLNIIDL